MSIDRENVLEAGFLVLGLGFIAGFGLLISGRLAADARRGRLWAEAAPASGSIPAERHLHLSPSAR